MQHQNNYKAPEQVGKLCAIGMTTKRSHSTNAASASSKYAIFHTLNWYTMKYDKRIIGFIDLSLSPDIRTLELQDQKSMGYTLRCQSAALWAYWHARSFEDGLLAIVRAGGDADTNAAVACSILGAKFGYDAIPEEYKEGLIYRKELDQVITGVANIINAQANL